MDIVNARSRILAVAILASGVAPQPLGAQDPGASLQLEHDVRTTVNRFKSALRSGDEEAVLELLHPDARIYESGHAETKENYRKGHLGADIAFLGAVETVTTGESVIVAQDIAIYLSEYSAKGEFRGRPIDLHGTETIVLVLTKEGWRIRHIHWSSS